MQVLHTIIYSACCLLLGLAALKQFLGNSTILQRHSAVSICSSAFILGQGLFATIWLILGLLSIFSKTNIWLFLVIGAALGCYFAGTLANNVVKQLYSAWLSVRELRRIWYPFLFLTSYLVLIYGVKSLTNLRLWEDGEAFYFVLPKIMANAEQLIVQRNYSSFTQIGLSGEMHYAALMSLSGELSARFFVWITALAITLVILAVCSEIGVKTLGKTFAVALLFTSTTFTLWLYGGKVEIFSTAFGVAAFFWAISITKESKLSEIAVVGIYTGLAIISKISYIPTLIPGILFVIGWNSLYAGQPTAAPERINKIAILRIVTVFSIFSFLPIVPNIIKNMVLFNEPLAPFLLFHSKATNLMTQSWYTKENTRYILLTYPIALTFGKYPMIGGNISPLILLGVVCSFFLNFRNTYLKHKVLLVTSAAVSGIIIWIIVAPSVLCPRYLLPSLLMLIPICALAYEYLMEHDFLLCTKISIYLVATGIVAITAFFITYSIYVDYRTLTGRRTVQSPYGDYHAAQLYLNSITNPGDRIFLDGYFSYYLRHDLLQCISGNDMNISPTADKGTFMLQAFDNGFKYLLIQKNISYIFNRYNMATNSGQVFADKLFEDNASVIYKLTASNQSLRPNWYCTQSKPNVWNVVKHSNK
jgi:hypothetical protein